jgi:hypothetical protein
MDSKELPYLLDLFPELCAYYSITALNRSYTYGPFFLWMTASVTANSPSFLLMPGGARAGIYKALFKNYRIKIDSQWKLLQDLEATRIGSPCSGHRHFVDSSVSGSSSLAIFSTCHTVHDEAIAHLSALATLEPTGSSAPN